MKHQKLFLSISFDRVSATNSRNRESFSFEYVSSDLEPNASIPGQSGFFMGTNTQSTTPDFLSKIKAEEKLNKLEN